MNEELYSITPGKRTSPYLKGRRNLIILGIIVVFGALCAIVGYSFWHSTTYSATVSLTYTPVSATATLDGSPIQSGNTKVKPGTHTITIKKDGFATQSSSIVATKDQTNTVNVVLVSNSPSTADWYLNNPADQTINEAIGADTAAAAADQLQATFPVSSILPLTGPSYSVDYGASPDKNGQFAIFITYYTVAGKQDALNAIQSLGYNPSDYEVIYTDGTQ